MTRSFISSGSVMEELAGYSRAVVDGDFVFVSGTTGFDYKAGTISEDLVEQTHQTFRNIQAALAQAGASLDDCVRAVFYLVRPEDFRTVGPLMKQYLGKAKPANTTVVAQLIDPRMLIEIEVTIRRRG